jgi:hypothetical protein
MGGVLPSVPKLFQQAKAAQPAPAPAPVQHLLKQKFLKVQQPMQMDLQQVLRQKEKADQQPY